jgi:hypothetical protein
MDFSGKPAYSIVKAADSVTTRSVELKNYRFLF